MQAILKSIRPRHILNIINGIKDLELSTTAPKDWLDYFNKKTDKKPDPILVLLYCTKGRPYLYRTCIVDEYECGFALNDEKHNGKVIGMFTLKQIYVQRMTTFSNAEQAFEMAKRACLTTDEFFAYQKDKTIYAWKIDDLVVFDKPKGLWEFKAYRPNACDKCWCEDNEDCLLNKNCPKHKSLTKAPQNWCYVEVEL